MEEPSVSTTPETTSSPTASSFPKPKVFYLSAGLLVFSLVAATSFLLGRVSVKPSPFSQALPTPTSVLPTPTPDETTNWKTYTNLTYSYSFKYPQEATPYGSEDQYKITFMGEKQKASGRTQTELWDGYIFSVSFRGKADETSSGKVAQSTYEGAKENCPPDARLTKISQTLVAGIISEIYKVTNCLGDYTEYFLSYGKNIFEITELYVGEPGDQAKYRITTQQILSTFRFD